MKPMDVRPSKRGKRRAAMLVLAVALATVSCGREDEGLADLRLPPHPVADRAAELIHAHYHLPARPSPPPVGMM